MITIVLKPYCDKDTRITHAPGAQVEYDDERAQTLIDLGYVAAAPGTGKPEGKPGKRTREKGNEKQD